MFRKMQRKQFLNSNYFQPSFNIQKLNKLKLELEHKPIHLDINYSSYKNY